MEGWEHIPVLSVNFSGLEKENAVELTLPLGKKLLYAFLYGDAMMWLKNQVKPYERNAGDTDRLVDQLIAELEEKFRKDDYSASKAFYREMIRRFAAIPRHHQKKIRVGIVGEIYMKYAPLGNHHLEDFLIEEGFEPVLSGVADFGLYCLENTRIDHRYYHRHALTFPFLTLAQNVLMRMQETFIRLVEEDGTFHAPDRFRDVIRNADGFIDQGVKMGEGWLLTAEIVSLIKEGVSNIVSAQPFGCLPNHIVAKGMARRIKEAYPQSNLVAIDYDPSASRVNQENRIRLMLANARLSEEELEDDAECAYAGAKKEKYA
ncbi:MAG: 2-hydroxyglutaryl-CoA dehydratase [Merdibacter sp.]